MARKVKEWVWGTYIKEFRVLRYADASGTTTHPRTTYPRTADMTQRLTTLADGTIEQADMKVKFSKTYTQQKVCKQKAVDKVTTPKKIKTKMKTYPHECEFAGAGCKARFKTTRGMHIHRARCEFRYYFVSFTEYEIERVVDGFWALCCLKCSDKDIQAKAAGSQSISWSPRAASLPSMSSGYARTRNQRRTTIMKTATTVDVTAGCVGG